MYSLENLEFPRKAYLTARIIFHYSHKNISCRIIYIGVGKKQNMDFELERTEQEGRKETLTQIVNGLSNHPALKGKLDLGLSGTRLLDQLVGYVSEWHQENPKDFVIHNAYHLLRRQYPDHFPKQKPNTGKRESKPESYKAINGF